MHIIRELEVYLTLKMRQKQIFRLKINSQVNFNAEFSAVQHLRASDGGAR